MVRMGNAVEQSATGDVLIGYSEPALQVVEARGKDRDAVEDQAELQIVSYSRTLRCFWVAQLPGIFCGPESSIARMTSNITARHF